MRSGSIVLLTCSVLFLGGGGALLGASTAWGLCKMSFYLWTSELGAEVGGGVLTVVGGILCLPTSWLAVIVLYNPRSYVLHGTLMCLALATMMLMLSGLRSASDLSRALREPSVLNSSMLQALAQANQDGSVRQAFDAMHLDLKCCGIQSYRDWLNSMTKIPPSCCGKLSSKRGEECKYPCYINGCLRPAMNQLHSYCKSVSVLSYCLIVALAATLFVTAYLLARSVLEHHEGVKPRQLRIACLSDQLPSPPPFAAVTSSVV